jgi:hypothetical protein
MNLDTYYRGLAAQSDAHTAAFQLADLSTQLLEMGVEAAGRRHQPGGA